jgi:hypothetical protein
MVMMVLKRVYIQEPEAWILLGLEGTLSGYPLVSFSSHSHLHFCVSERDLAFNQDRFEFQRETGGNSFGLWREKWKEIRYIPTLYISNNKRVRYGGCYRGIIMGFPKDLRFVFVSVSVCVCVFVF